MRLRVILSGVAATFVLLGVGIRAEDADLRTRAGDSRFQLLNSGGSFIRSPHEAPPTWIDASGRILSPLPDGGGADVVDLEVFQITYALPEPAPDTGNSVRVVWNENTFNAPGSLRVSIDGNILAVFDGRPVTAPFPGSDSVRITNIVAGEHVVLLEAVNGGQVTSSGEARIVILDEAPLEQIDSFRCFSAGPGTEDQVCQLALRWDDLTPRASRYLVFLGNIPVTRIPADFAGAILQAPAGDYCFELMSVMDTPDGSYARVQESCCTLACQPGACSPPEDLGLHQGSYGDFPTVVARWTNSSPRQDQVFALIDGQVAGGPFAGGTSSLTFAGFPTGIVNLGVEGGCGIERSGLVEQAFQVLPDSPHVNPIEGEIQSVHNPANGETTVSWTLADPSLWMDLFVDAGGDPSQRAFIASRILPDRSPLVINGMTPKDLPVLQFFTFVADACYASDFLVSSPPPEGNTFVRGNCDGQSPAQVGTGIFLFNWLFLSGPIPACIAACDTDGDGANSINDGVFLLNYLFLNGNTPPGWVDGDGDGTAEETCEFAPETECRESQGTCAS